MGTTYPKAFMTIAELAEMGLPKDYLKSISCAENAPIIRTVGNGKILFKTSELDEFMDGITKKVEARRKLTRGYIRQ